MAHDESDETVECPTCEQERLAKQMSGKECILCEHIRDDARDAKRSAEREAAEEADNAGYF